VTNLVLCSIILGRFPDDDSLQTETCRNILCDIVTNIYGTGWCILLVLCRKLVTDNARNEQHNFYDFVLQYEELVGVTSYFAPNYHQSIVEQSTFWMSELQFDH
jgi:hypothetical protein